MIKMAPYPQWFFFPRVTLTQLQQGAYYLCLDVTQLAVELPLGCSQLVEAGDEAHHVPVRERHAASAARKHTADVAKLENTRNNIKKIHAKPENQQINTSYFVLTFMQKGSSTGCGV